MHLTTFTLLFLPLLSIPALASPILPRALWTIQSFTRTCNDTANTCHYAYNINTNDGSAATPCIYDVVGSANSKAETQSYNSVACGVFFVGSTWSGQFGSGHGFQTLSVVTGGQIIYPAYADTELVNGVAVSPDKSYTPQPLPRGRYVAPVSPESKMG